MAVSAQAQGPVAPPAELPEAPPSEADSAAPDGEGPVVEADAPESSDDAVIEDARERTGVPASEGVLGPGADGVESPQVRADTPPETAPTGTAPPAARRLSAEEMEAALEAEGRRGPRTEVQQLDSERPGDAERLRGERFADGEDAAIEPLVPWRFTGRLGVGVGVRTSAREDFQQNVLSPAYFALRGGVVLPRIHSTGRVAIRHGLSLGASANINRDGTYPSGVQPWRQWTFTPSYEFRLSTKVELPALEGVARIGVPIAVAPDPTTGLELGVGAQYKFLAGFGIYGEVIYNVFFGGNARNGEGTQHHLIALELGLVWELERL
ncbi:MAG: hypothetical protein AAF938_10635 [Myxococcota bacterium]